MNFRHYSIICVALSVMMASCERNMEDSTMHSEFEDEGGEQFTIVIKGSKGVKGEIEDLLKENGATKDGGFGIVGPIIVVPSIYSTSGGKILITGEPDALVIAAYGPTPPDQSVKEMFEKLTAYAKKHYTLLQSDYDPGPDYLRENSKVKERLKIIGN